MIHTIGQLEELSICLLTAVLFAYIFEMTNVYAQDTALQTFNSPEFKVDYPSS
jgi:hypothetical protein